MHGLGIIIGKIPRTVMLDLVYNLIFPSAYFVTNDTSSSILYTLYCCYCISTVVVNVVQIISHLVPGL